MFFLSLIYASTSTLWILNACIWSCFVTLLGNLVFCYSRSAPWILLRSFSISFLFATLVGDASPSRLCSASLNISKCAGLLKIESFGSLLVGLRSMVGECEVLLFFPFPLVLTLFNLLAVWRLKSETLSELWPMLLSFSSPPSGRPVLDSRARTRLSSYLHVPL